MMRKSAQSKTIKETFDDAIVEDFNVCSKVTAVEHLHQVLTKAKEKGMTAENIYQFFSGNANTVTVDKFISNLEKLGGSFASFSQEDVMAMVNAISKNSDGIISLEEFKHYCYTEIQTISWKAERLRLEESGEIEKLKAQLSRKFVGSTDSFHGCGDEVFHSAVFLWRNNASIEIRLYYCQALGVLTVHLFNQTTNDELPNLYLCMNRVEKKLVSMNKEVQRSLDATNENGLYSKEELSSIESRLRWDYIAKYVISLLSIKSSATNQEDSYVGDDFRFIPYLKADTGKYLSLTIFDAKEFHEYFDECLNLIFEFFRPFNIQTHQFDSTGNSFESCNHR